MRAFTALRPKLLQEKLKIQQLKYSRTNFVSSASFPQLYHRSHSHTTPFSERIKNGPSLQDFITQNEHNDTLKDETITTADKVPYLNLNEVGKGRKLFVETYGCQMNVSDTEIVVSIMKNAGFEEAKEVDDADVVFLNTCAIREKAESKIWDRLGYFKNLKRKKNRDLMVGVLGCMAERLKTTLLESDKLVDLVVGPDAYRDLPKLVAKVDEVGEPSINVILSQDETYADVTPVRTSSNNISAFVSIMRGCNNMCSYCIVPFTRGRERSRPTASIEEEVRQLSQQGFKEITLLGQNVNSYNYVDESVGAKDQEPSLAKGFKTIYKPTPGGIRFTELMDRISRIDPEMRIRFTSPHPKDFPDELIDLIKERPNICKSLHMPAQSGNTAVLERMRRGYTREAYLELVDRIKQRIPEVALSSDFISGFCGETDEEHMDTISLLEHVKFHQAFMFAYSLREKTHAHRHLKDDVPAEVKNKRLQQVIETYNKHAVENNRQEISKVHLVLVEGNSKRSANDLSGRTDTNKKVVFPNVPVTDNIWEQNNGNMVPVKPGDYVAVKIDSATSFSLKGTPIAKTSLVNFYKWKDQQK